MFPIVGAIIVVGCVFGGFVALGGHLEVLWQPFEFVIICGAALGAFVISNPPKVVTGTFKAMIQVLKGQKYKKRDYMDLLGLLFSIFKLAKQKGLLSIEPHVEKPEESEIFKRFPRILHDHHVVTFLTDYLRLLTIGAENAHEMVEVLDQEIETHHAEHARIAAAVQAVADGMPALGIVAAVLGVIKTMGAITEPPEVLGHLIGGALVGTFLGVWLAYGFIGPVASALVHIYDAETKYYQCMKSGILAYMQGHAPAIAVEFARKALMSEVRPSFQEVEDAMAQLPAS